jgi:hypothetical protein
MGSTRPRAPASRDRSGFAHHDRKEAVISNYDTTLHLRNELGDMPEQQRLAEYSQWRDPIGFLALGSVIVGTL